VKATLIVDGFEIQYLLFLPDVGSPFLNAFSVCSAGTVAETLALYSATNDDIIFQSSCHAGIDADKKETAKKKLKFPSASWLFPSTESSFSRKI
jgi:hypothetical protein